jgi:hypothetical protein
MNKAILTITEDDLHQIARDKIGRELTPAEMRTAAGNFEFGIEWAETAEIAVDAAIEEHK